MPSNAPIIHSWGKLPEGYKPGTWENLKESILKLLSSYLPGNYTVWNIGDNKPDPEDQDKPWYRTNAGVPDKVFYFYNGVWSSLHPIPPSSSFRMMWLGTPGELWAHDGGDGDDPSVTAPTIQSGAMWQVDTAFAAKFPVGVGTFDASGEMNTHSMSATLSGTAGEDKHTLLEAELAAHSHTFAIYKGDGVNNSDDKINTTDETVVADSIFPTTTVGSDTPHNNLPPFYSAYFAKRTIRQFYTVD